MHPDSSVRTFLHEQLIKRVDKVDLALFDAPHCGIEDFESARRTQHHQAVLDAAVDGRSHGEGGDDRPPRSASRSPHVQAVLQASTA